MTATADAVLRNATEQRFWQRAALRAAEASLGPDQAGLYADRLLHLFRERGGSERSDPERQLREARLASLMGLGRAVLEMLASRLRQDHELDQLDVELREGELVAAAGELLRVVREHFPASSSSSGSGARHPLDVAASRLQRALVAAAGAGPLTAEPGAGDGAEGRIAPDPTRWRCSFRNEHGRCRRAAGHPGACDPGKTPLGADPGSGGSSGEPNGESGA